MSINKEYHKTINMSRKIVIVMEGGEHSCPLFADVPPLAGIADRNVRSLRFTPQKTKRHRQTNTIVCA